MRKGFPCEASCVGAVCVLQGRQPLTKALVPGRCRSSWMLGGGRAETQPGLSCLCHRHGGDGGRVGEVAGQEVNLTSVS